MFPPRPSKTAPGLEVEVRQLRRTATASARPRLKQTLSWLFGLGCALAWHFLHTIGETYPAGLADPHFWLHLALEGLLALYAAALFFIFWTVIARFRPK